MTPQLEARDLGSDVRPRDCRADRGRVWLNVLLHLQRRCGVDGRAGHPPHAAVSRDRRGEQGRERTAKREPIVGAEEDPGPAERRRPARTHKQCMPEEAQQERHELFQVVANQPVGGEHCPVAAAVLHLSKSRSPFASCLGLPPQLRELAEGCGALVEEEDVEQSDSGAGNECHGHEGCTRRRWPWRHRFGAPGEDRRRKESS
mmetsp:Transcript_36719/g.115402  ORF Transcript_36719/g.115402 Transcript_36719/m.115402 type:complete len:203 (+) Transcript_36719:89-697(+)